MPPAFGDPYPQDFDNSDDASADSLVIDYELSAALDILRQARLRSDCFAPLFLDVDDMRMLPASEVLKAAEERASFLLSLLGFNSSGEGLLLSDLRDRMEAVDTVFCALDEVRKSIQGAEAFPRTTFDEMEAACGLDAKAPSGDKIFCYATRAAKSFSADSGDKIKEDNLLWLAARLGRSLLKDKSDRVSHFFMISHPERYRHTNVAFTIATDLREEYQKMLKSFALPFGKEGGKKKDLFAKALLLYLMHLDSRRALLRARHCLER